MHPGEHYTRFFIRRETMHPGAHYTGFFTGRGAMHQGAYPLYKFFMVGWQCIQGHITETFLWEGDNAFRGTLHRLFIGRGTICPGPGAHFRDSPFIDRGRMV
jgi:hypothetical protein